MEEEALRLRDELPKYEEYYVAIVNSLRSYGGSATNKQIEEAVSDSLKLSDEALIIAQPGDSRSKYRYQLAWARTHLRSKGIINNIGRGHWQLATTEVTDGELRRLDAQTNSTFAIIPAQGDGPKFTVKRGVIAFAKPVGSLAGNQAKLTSLHPVLVQTTEALVQSLSENSGLWPNLERSVSRYRELIGEPLSSLDIPRIFGEGVVLSNALAEARRQEVSGNAFPVANEPALLADSLIHIHGAFLMLSREGKALAMAGRHFQLSKAPPRSENAEQALVAALVDSSAPVRDDVKQHIADVAKIDAKGESDSHTNTYKSATLNNIAIAITGATVIAAIAAAGGVIGLGLGAAAVALVGSESLKKTSAFKGSTDYLAGLLDGALTRFFNAHKTEISAVSGGKNSDMDQALRWLNYLGSIESNAPVLPGTRPSQTALLLEPDVMQAQQISDQLKLIGISVVGLARTYRDAVAYASELKPDYIFAETILVDGSGIRAVHEIMQNQSVKAVFVTANPERLLMEARPEPSRLITKPFNQQALVDSVAEAQITPPKTT